MTASGCSAPYVQRAVARAASRGSSRALEAEHVWASPGSHRRRDHRLAQRSSTCPRASPAVKSPSSWTQGARCRPESRSCTRSVRAGRASPRSPPAARTSLMIHSTDRCTVPDVSAARGDHGSLWRPCVVARTRLRRPARRRCGVARCWGFRAARRADPYAVRGSHRFRIHGGGHARVGSRARYGFLELRRPATSGGRALGS